MKRLNIIGLFTIVAALVIQTLPAFADSPVWKISKGKQYLYIGGTIHLLSKTDYPLPAAFDQAYKQSTHLVLEADAQTLKSPEFSQQVLAHSVYDDGRTLKQVLKPETFQALEKYLSNRGIPIAGMLNFKPSMLAITLTVIELQRLGLAGKGVDEFFSQRAINDKKTLGYLETAEQQLAFLTAMGVGQEDEMIAYTLRDIERLPGMIRSMKEAWRQGDNRKLKTVALTSWKKDFPKVYETLLVKRNEAWMPHIEAMLKTSQVELVLVGALHLVGDDGVLTKLSAKGYKIEQL